MPNDKAPGQAASAVCDSRDRAARTGLHNDRGKDFDPHCRRFAANGGIHCPAGNVSLFARRSTAPRATAGKGRNG